MSSTKLLQRMFGLTLGVLILAACAGLGPEPTLSIGSTRVREVDDMVMVFVPGGTFQMGNEAGDPNAGEGDEMPPHPVTLDSFWIDRTEVTNAQYARCVTAGVCSPPSSLKSATRDSYYGDSQYDDHPVIYVSWNDATTYCQWAGGQLPTEAQWEYAARGPDSSVYPWGDDLTDDALLNYKLKVGDTTQVGSYPGGASWIGALDMAGNVLEWVSDWYADDYYALSPAENPTGPNTGEQKVYRGGSWLALFPWYVRSANRYRHSPVLPDPSVGFRCVIPATSSP